MMVERHLEHASLDGGARADLVDAQNLVADHPKADLHHRELAGPGDLEQRQMLRLGSFGGNAEFAATQLRLPFLAQQLDVEDLDAERTALGKSAGERKSTRLNSSH